jgi:hypothetical protein
MLAVAEDKLVAVDEVTAEELDATLDVKVFTADTVPDAALDTVEIVLVGTGATVVIELPDAMVVGIVADPVVAGDDSALLSRDPVADSVLLAVLALAELGVGGPVASETL